MNKKKPDLTVAEDRTYKVLLMIYNSGQIVKMSSLVEAIGVARTSIHRDISSLIRKGLIQRYDNFFYKPKGK
jgi:DNA-binding MarR family transcriptional regulator